MGTDAGIRSSSTEASWPDPLLAWEGLAMGPRANHVEIIKPPHRKSAVFRIFLNDGRRVIAKSCRKATATLEAAIYQDVLPSRAPAPQFYGLLPEGPRAWLFLEDVRGVPFSVDHPSHLGAAARWLGYVHDSIGPRSVEHALPQRGASYYRAIVLETLRVLQGARSNRAWPDEHREALEGLALACHGLLERWEDVGAILSAIPETLVHGDFSRKNVTIRSMKDGLEAVPFDWETAGWGPPVADIAQVDLPLYLATRTTIDRSDWGAWRTAASLGTILWHIAPIPGEARSVLTRYPRSVAQKLSYYDAAVRQGALRLGWNRQ